MTDTDDTPKIPHKRLLSWRLNDEPDFHNVYQLRNVKSGALFTDIIEFHMIELPKLPSEGDGDFYNWMRLIAAEEEEMEMIAKRGAVFEKAVRKVRYFSADEQTRLLIESYEKARRDELMRINDAYEDGEAKGKAKGKAEGELKTYIGLVRDHIVEPSVAAARLHISESEFRAKCDAAPDNVF